jgi:hypothetical protein
MKKGKTPNKGMRERKKNQSLNKKTTLESVERIMGPSPIMKLKT